MRDFDCSVKRYLNIFLVKPKFLLIVIVIPLVFYLYALTIPVSYEIANSVLFTEETGLVLPGPDNVLLSRETLLQAPDLLLLNVSLIAELNHLITRNWENPDESTARLSGSILESLSLEMSGDDHLRVLYKGPQLSTGSLMVYFYSRKIVAHSSVEEGTGQSQSSGRGRVAGIGFFNRDLEVKKNYRLWDQRRLYPLGVVAFCSFLLMIFVVGIAEWMDSSLKTEHQASRYLDLPVMGAFPNFQELGTILSRSADSQKPGEDLRG
ncbi:MAG: hypothetical protein ABIJ42_09945 [Acidobacteriota bacterium]